MKKKLVASLAAAMVLGVAGTSFAAANPFTDVPAKHWAYDSVMKLSQAGIVDGYGDGTYKGDKLISRYEMAQMVAKAMARSDKADAAQKAQIDKLAAEFAEELNVLGVRVSNLEKKVGTVKITGDARVRAYSVNNITTARQTAIQERFRLNMTADVNENTSMYARLMMGHNTMGVDGGTIAPGGGYATTGVTAFQLADAAFTTKNAFNTSAAFTLGRFSQNIGVTSYLVGTTGFVDGAKVAFGNQVKVTTGYASFKNAIADLNDVAFATATYNTSKATTLVAGYFKEVGRGTSTLITTNLPANVAPGVNNSNTYDIGFTSKLDKNFAVTGEYMKNTFFSTNNDGYIARLSYKGANAQKPGSWGTFVEYYKMKVNAGFAGAYGDYGTGSITNFNSNKSAVDLQATFVVAKNMTVDAVSTFNTKTVSTNAKAANYERIQVNYMF